MDFMIYELCLNFFLNRGPRYYQRMEIPSSRESLPLLALKKQPAINSTGANNLRDLGSKFFPSESPGKNAVQLTP